MDPCVGKRFALLEEQVIQYLSTREVQQILYPEAFCPHQQINYYLTLHRDSKNKTVQ